MSQLPGKIAGAAGNVIVALMLSAAALQVGFEIGHAAMNLAEGNLLGGVVWMVISTHEKKA